MKHHDPRGWPARFRDAFRGVRIGTSGQPSFLVHGLAALAVVIAGAILRVSLVQWCLLVLCITMVLVAEMFNTSLESMAKAVDRRENPRIGAALDIASAAVLLAAAGAALVGATVFGQRLGVWLQWWNG